MPDRAVIPLVCAVSLGFLAGLAAAVFEMTGGQAAGLAVPAALLVALAGAASVIGAPLERPALVRLAARRALLGAAVFTAIFLAMIAFLKSGHVLLTIVWAIVAGVCCGGLVKQPGKTQAQR
jgi:Na+/melibiose symporter-like transporter